LFDFDFLPASEEAEASRFFCARPFLLFEDLLWLPFFAASSSDSVGSASLEETSLFDPLVLSVFLPFPVDFDFVGDFGVEVIGSATSSSSSSTSAAGPSGRSSSERYFFGDKLLDARYALSSSTNSAQLDL